MRVLHDIFPARVLVAPPSHSVPLAELTTKTSKPMPPTRLVEAVRILITDSHVLIAADSHVGPVTIFSEKISQLNWSGSRNKESSLVTETGKMLVFVRDDNCGCGSKLRTWNPYNTLNSSKDPIE
jgi:hypothetical protein